MPQNTSQRSRPANRGLARAIEIAGGQSALAKAIGRKQASVWGWVHQASRVSAEDAIAIEGATGVPAEQINSALAAFARLRGIEVRKAA